MFSLVWGMIDGVLQPFDKQKWVWPVISINVGEDVRICFVGDRKSFPIVQNWAHDEFVYGDGIFVALDVFGTLCITMLAEVVDAGSIIVKPYPYCNVKYFVDFISH